MVFGFKAFVSYSQSSPLISITCYCIHYVSIKGVFFFSQVIKDFLSGNLALETF